MIECAWNNYTTRTERARACYKDILTRTKSNFGDYGNIISETNNKKRAKIREKSRKNKRILEYEKKLKIQSIKLLNERISKKHTQRSKKIECTNWSPLIVVIVSFSTPSIDKHTLGTSTLTDQIKRSQHICSANRTNSHYYLFKYAKIKQTRRQIITISSSDCAECVNWPSVHRECSISFRSLCVDNVELMLFICKFPFLRNFNVFIFALRLELFRLDPTGKTMRRKETECIRIISLGRYKNKLSIHPFHWYTVQCTRAFVLLSMVYALPYAFIDLVTGWSSTQLLFLTVWGNAIDVLV